VIYMGRETLAGLAAHLIEAGMSPTMPAIAIENASLPSEHMIRSTLSCLPGILLAGGKGNAGPTLILLGEALRNAAARAAAFKMALAG
jgi:siroheme synthase